MKTPQQRERERLYAAAYRATHPKLPKTPEQLEKRRLWQIEYRKLKPVAKLSPEQKEVKAERQRQNRLAKKRDREIFVKARIAKVQERKLERLRLIAENKEARRIANNAKRKPTLAQLGIEAKPRGRKAFLPKPVRTPQKHKHIMRPMQKIKERAKVLQTIQHDLSKKVKLHIPELRMDVYINPGQDIEAVRQKYLKR